MIFLSAISDVFTELFLGSGAWLGLLLLLTFIIGLTFAWKYGGLLMLPVSIFLGIYYFDAALGWHGTLMILTSIFILASVINTTRKGGER